MAVDSHLPASIVELPDVAEHEDTAVETVEKAKDIGAAKAGERQPDGAETDPNWPQIGFGSFP